MTQDIIIYPTSGEPEIVFTGSGVGASNLTLKVLEDSSVRFLGEGGNLFEIDNTNGVVIIPSLSSPELNNYVLTSTNNTLSSTVFNHIASASVHYPSSVVTSWVSSNYSPTSHTHSNYSLTSHVHDATAITTGYLNYARIQESTRLYQVDPMIPDNGDISVHLGQPSIGQAAVDKTYMENKMQFAPPNICEYSNDYGATWSSAPFTSDQLKNLVKGRYDGTNLTVDRSWTHLRIGWDASAYSYGYVYLNIFYSFFSTNGNYISSIVIDKNVTDTSTLTNVVSATGSYGSWPGHLWVPHSSIPFTTSTGRCNLAIVTLGFNWAHASNNINIYNINWHGSYPAANQDRLYYWDKDKNTTFKGNVISQGSVGINSSFMLSSLGDSFLGGSLNNVIDWSQEAENTSLGYGALRYLTSGDFNTALGAYALENNDNGNNNTALGARALRNTTTGSQNTAVGYNSLLLNVSGPNNTAVGYGALTYNTSSSNTAIGDTSLYNNTVGHSNTAIGRQSLYRNTSGVENVAVGFASLYNSSGSAANGNVAIGRASIYTNPNSVHNTGVGLNTLFYTSGNYNTAIGAQAGQNSQGSNNFFGGRYSGFNASGSNNILIGYQAGYDNSTYDNTIVIGIDVDASSSNQTVIGSDIISSTIIYGYTQFPDGLNASFSGLTDTEFASVIDGQTVIWSGAANKWVNTTPSEGVTDHALLTGLSANDHPQYVLSSTNSTLSSTVSNHIASGDVHYPSSIVTDWVTDQGYAAATSLDNYVLTSVNNTLSSTVSNHIASASVHYPSSVVTSWVTGQGYVSSTQLNNYLTTSTFSNFSSVTLQDLAYRDTVNNTYLDSGSYSKITGLGTQNSNLQASSSNVSLKKWSMIQSGYIEQSPVNFRFDQDVLRFANRWGTATINTSGGLTNDHVDRLLSQYAEYVNLSVLSDPVVLEISGLNIGNSANSHFYPYVLMHSTPGVSCTMEILKVGNPTEWVNVYSGLVDSYKIAEVSVASGNLAGARWTFYGWTGSTYVRSVGVIGRNSQGYAWNVMKNGDTMYGNLAIASPYTLTVASSINGMTFASSGTNTFIGKNSVSSYNTGANYNIAIGEEALRSLSSNDYNVAIGYKALKNADYGSHNIALGFESQTSSNNNYNVSIGSYTLQSTTSGAHNTAIGHNSQKTTIAGYNTSLGSNSLYSNDYGVNNVAVGYNSLYYTTSGYNNTAVGVNSLLNNTTGLYNTSIGANSGRGITTGSYNTALGHETLYYVSSGNYNTAVGHRSLQNNQSKNENTAVGFDTLRNNVTGQNNVAVGSRAGFNASGSNNILIGKDAGFDNSTYNNTIVIGYDVDASSSNQTVLGSPTTSSTVIYGYTVFPGGISASDYVLTSVNNSLSTTVSNHIASGEVHYPSSIVTDWVIDQGYAAATSLDNYVLTSVNNTLSSTVSNHIASASVHFPSSVVTDWVTDQGYAAATSLDNYVLTSVNNTLSSTVSNHIASASVHYPSSVITTWVNNQSFVQNSYANIDIEGDVLSAAGQDTLYLAGDTFISWTIDAGTIYANFNQNALSSTAPYYATSSWVANQGYAAATSLTQYAALSGATFTGNVLAPSVSATELSATKVNGGDLVVAVYTSIQSGDILLWDGTASSWINSGVSFVDSLSSLTDVTVSSVSANQSLVWDGSKWKNDFQYDTELYSTYWDDRLNAATWNYYGNGTGNGRFASTANINSTENAQGVVVVQTGTTSTGIGCEYLGFYNISTNNIFEVEMRISVQTSSAGNTCIIDYGFFNNYNVTSAPTYGAIVRYDGTGSPNWVCQTLNGATTSSTTSTIAVSNISPMDIIKIVIDGPQNKTQYYINGVLEATHNIIPDGTSAQAIGVKNTKTSGTTSKYAYMDWVRINMYRTSAR